MKILLPIGCYPKSCILIGIEVTMNNVISLHFSINLIQVLIRFHQYQYAVSADIEGIFLQLGFLVLFHKAKRHFVFFCGETTQLKKSLCTSTCVTFLEPKFRQHAPIMRSNGTQLTTKPRLPKPLLA